MEAWTTAAPWLGAVGLIVAFVIYNRLKAGDAGSPEMVEISDDIHEGAMAFLKREYSILLLFIAVVFLGLWLGVGGRTAIHAGSWRGAHGIGTGRNGSAWTAVMRAF